MTDAPEPSVSGPRSRLAWMIPLALLGPVFLIFRFQVDLTLAPHGVNDFMGMYTHARLV